MRPESSSKVSRPEWVAVIALLLLAFALRTIDLTRVPPGLHNDEVIETNIAETVAGGRWAIFFPEDTGSEGLHYYFAALFIRLFGDTVYALRLPAMALSLISMCVVWALARRLFGPIVALSALAGFAIVFWPLAFGRIISHTIMEVPVAALSAYFFWRAVGASRRRAHTASGRRAWRMWAFSGVWL
ncbi:MAG TPA: glycosyltransferase family 39 protein, partial [Anaerolineae bacterium]